MCKFLTDFSSLRTLTWSRKFAKSTENCYSIQEGRVIDRSREGHCNASIRSNLNHKTRSSSPSNQSISSIKTISTSTPTYFTTLRRLHRHKLASVLDFDKEAWREESQSITSIIEDDYCNKSELIRGTNCVPYREKRNPLSHTRLSCYKPVISEQQLDIKNLKNFKSVDDFLSMDVNNAQSSMDQISDVEITKMIEKDESHLKHKRKSIGSKFRTMSDKTQKLFSKLYSKSTVTDSSNEMATRENSNAPIVLNRHKSLSYGTLTQVKEFDTKKREAEDGDSGIILINETSGASSMTDENSETNKKVEQEMFKMPPERKYVQR